MSELPYRGRYQCRRSPLAPLCKREGSLMQSYLVQMAYFLLGIQLPQCHFLYASSSGAEIKPTKL